MSDSLRALADERISQQARAFGEIAAGRLGSFAAMPEDTGVGEALGIYAGLFWGLTWIGVGTGIVVLVCTPWLRRRMHGVH